MKPYTRFTSPDSKPIYVNPIDIEVRPGVKVRDLETPAQCAVAIQELDAEITNIASQIAKADAGTMKVGEGWKKKAEAAKRWKKRALKAIRAHADIIGGLVAEAGVARRQAILDVIAEDVGGEAMERYRRIARHRHPELFGTAEASSIQEGSDVPSGLSAG